MSVLVLCKVLLLSTRPCRSVLSRPTRLLVELFADSPKSIKTHSMEPTSHQILPSCKHQQHPHRPTPLTTTRQRPTDIATNNLTRRSRLRSKPQLLAFARMVDSANPCGRTSELRLQGDRVYAVSVKAFANALCLRHEIHKR